METVKADLVGDLLGRWVDQARHLWHEVNRRTGHETYKAEQRKRMDALLPRIYELAVAHGGYRAETILTADNDAKAARRAGVEPDTPAGVLAVWAFRPDQMFQSCEGGVCDCGTIPVPPRLPARA